MAEHVACVILDLAEDDEAHIAQAADVLLAAFATWAGAFPTIGVGLWLESWITFIRPEEEADLAARFGQDYEAYRAAIRCWIPTWRAVTVDRTGSPPRRVRSEETGRPS